MMKKDEKEELRQELKEIEILINGLIHIIDLIIAGFIGVIINFYYLSDYKNLKQAFMIFAFILIFQIPLWFIKSKIALMMNKKTLLTILFPFLISSFFNSSFFHSHAIGALKVTETVQTSKKHRISFGERLFNIILRLSATFARRK